MSLIRSRVVSRLRPDKVAEGKEIARRMLAYAEERGASLGYEYYTDESTGALVCLESFESSEAWLEHVRGNPYAQEFVAVTESVSLELYGNASAELRATLDAFGSVTYFPPAF